MCPANSASSDGTARGGLPRNTMRKRSPVPLPPSRFVCPPSRPTSVGPVPMDTAPNFGRGGVLDRSRGSALLLSDD